MCLLKNFLCLCTNLFLEIDDQRIVGERQLSEGVGREQERGKSANPGHGQRPSSRINSAASRAMGSASTGRSNSRYQSASQDKAMPMFWISPAMRASATYAARCKGRVSRPRLARASDGHVRRRRLRSQRLASDHVGEPDDSSRIE